MRVIIKQQWTGNKSNRSECLTRAEVDAVQQAAHPGHLADSLAEVLDELRHEDTEAVGDAVDDHVTDEGCGHHHPAVAAVGGRRYLGELQITHVHVGDAVCRENTGTARRLDGGI